MLREDELVEKAEIYREMADQAVDVRPKLEFVERAERYETVLSALRRTKYA